MSHSSFSTIVSADRIVKLPGDWPVGARLRIEMEPPTMEPPTGDNVVDHYQPRTELGRKLLELRRAYIEKGGKLLIEDEILAEVRSRR